MKRGHCTRCGSYAKVLPIFTVRPGAHRQSADLEPPQAEAACENCITDKELSYILNPVAEFVLDTIPRDLGSPDAASLDIVAAMFKIRNNNPDGHNRQAALRAAGFKG